MKSIRIATAVKYLDDADQTVTLFRIQEILSEHRSALIMRILGDLPTYLQFKFYAKVDKVRQEQLRDKLFALSNARVSLDRYADIVREIKSNDSYRVPTQEFFFEIDTVLDAHLNPSQLELIA